jgi:hypothetical protein
MPGEPSRRLISRAFGWEILLASAFGSKTETRSMSKPATTILALDVDSIAMRWWANSAADSRHLAGFAE